jgi:hypothetical protein
VTISSGRKGGGVIQRVVDRITGRYFEHIEDKETGELVKHVEEELGDYFGHSPDKRRK